MAEGDRGTEGAVIPDIGHRESMGQGRRKGQGNRRGQGTDDWGLAGVDS